MVSHGSFFFLMSKDWLLYNNFPVNNRSFKPLQEKLGSLIHGIHEALVQKGAPTHATGTHQKANVGDERKRGISGMFSTSCIFQILAAQLDDLDPFRFTYRIFSSSAWNH